MQFSEIITRVGEVVDVIGVAALIIGISMATVWFLRGIARREKFNDVYRGYRRGLGRALLLGLELLVAADIIRTVAVEPTLENVAALGLVVIIRTFLSWSLEVEVNGRFPWQKEEEKVEDRI